MSDGGPVANKALKVPSSDPLWIYPKFDEAMKNGLIQEFHLHPVVAQVLMSRGITSKEDIHYYLYAKLPDLHDPFLFAEMPAAV